MLFVSSSSNYDFWWRFDTHPNLLFWDRLMVLNQFNNSSGCGHELPTVQPKCSLQVRQNKHEIRYDIIYSRLLKHLLPMTSNITIKLQYIWKEIYLLKFQMSLHIMASPFRKVHMSLARIEISGSFSNVVVRRCFFLVLSTFCVTTTSINAWTTHGLIQTNRQGSDRRACEWILFWTSFSNSTEYQGWGNH